MRSVLFLTAFAGAVVAIPPGPEQLHVHAANNDTSSGEFKVMWVHQAAMRIVTPTNPGVIQRPSSGGSPSPKVDAECSTYTFGGFAGTICIADVAGVPVGGSVQYQVGSDSLGWSTWRTLRNPDADSVKMLAWADMGIEWSQGTMAYLASDAASGEYSAVLATGDMSYADDHKPDTNNSWVWDLFLNQAEPHLDGSAGPWIQICGNHESQDDFEAYLSRTWSYTPSSGNLSRFYYSTTVGPATVISFSTEHDVTPGSEIHNYLTQALAHASSPAVRAQHPWIIVQTHHPLLCTDVLTWQTRCVEEASAFRTSLEGLFREAQVDVFFSGHNHMMEVSYPYYNGTWTTDLHNASASGTVYIVNGAAGDMEGIEPLFMPDQGYRMFDSQFSFNTSYARLAINHTAFQADFVDSHTGQVINTFTLTKS